MKFSIHIIAVTFIMGGLLLNCNSPKPTEDSAPAQETVSDPLPSWNDGAVKTAIINFVDRVTKEGSADYIPPADRIATFDNDGTLWAEQPVVQGMFAFMRAKKMAEKDPTLKANKYPHMTLRVVWNIFWPNFYFEPVQTGKNVD